MISTSLKSTEELASIAFTLLPREASFDNYAAAMQRGSWLKYFWNSFYVTFVTVFISLFINSIAGYSFARLRFRGRDALFIVSLVGLMIPPQTTMIPVFIMLRHFPLAGGNDFFGQGGLGLVNTYAGLIIPFIAGSYGVFLFRQFYLNFPHSLDDAAEIDGLGKVKTFYLIYVPLSKPVFATLGALKATQTWNEYIWPLIITTTDEMKTVQLALSFFRDEYEIQWNYLMAATAIITLPLILIYLFSQKYFVEGIVTTGIKA
jgi:multiple sugar transport system permease protein